MLENNKITGEYIEGVYLNEIRIDWVKIKMDQKGKMKDSPLDPADVPDQINTNLRIGFKDYSLDCKFNFSNADREQLFKNIQDIFLKKQQITIITSKEIIENCLITSISTELDKFNMSFNLDVQQFQTAKITSTGNPKEGEGTQVNQTTAVGTQGVTASNAQGGYLT